MEINNEPFKKYIEDLIKNSGAPEYKAGSNFIKFLRIFLSMFLVGLPWLIVNKRKEKAFKKVVYDVLPDPEELYRKFFELSIKSTEDKIEFDGFCDSSLLKEDGTGLHFGINDEDYEFDVYEWTEIRTREVRDPQSGAIRVEEYTVYFYKTAAETFVPKVENYELVTLSNNSKLKSLFTRKKNSGYQTESIAFNKRFNVVGDNELQIVKLLRPTVIENFIENPKYKLDGIIDIEKGYVDSYFVSGESRTYQDMGVAEQIKRFSLSPSLEEGITRKIEKDFKNAFSLYRTIKKLKIDK